VALHFGQTVMAVRYLTRFNPASPAPGLPHLARLEPRADRVRSSAVRRHQGRCRAGEPN
jgi:hypothetical protein